MKKLFFVIALAATFMVGCQKEDDVAPIDSDAIRYSYWIMGNDTLEHLYVVRSYTDVPIYRIHRYDYNLWLIAAEDSLGHSDTLVSTNTGHPGILSVYRSAMWIDGYECNYTMVTRRMGDVFDLQVDGEILDSAHTPIHIHYRDTLTNINAYSGKGKLVCNHDTIPVYQLALRDAGRGWHYELCDSYNLDTYFKGRICIFGSPQSGAYNLAQSDELQVYYEYGVAGNYINRYRLTSGTLQFSENNGRYAIMCDGTTSNYMTISFDYQGSLAEQHYNPWSFTSDDINLNF